MVYSLGMFVDINCTHAPDLPSLDCSQAQVDQG